MLVYYNVDTENGINNQSQSRLSAFISLIHAIELTCQLLFFWSNKDRIVRQAGLSNLGEKPLSDVHFLNLWIEEFNLINWIIMTRRFGKHCVLHTEQLNICLDFIKSHQRSISWYPPLEIQPATTECRAETLPLRYGPHRTQAMPN